MEKITFTFELPEDVYGAKIAMHSMDIVSGVTQFQYTLFRHWNKGTSELDSYIKDALAAAVDTNDIQSATADYYVAIAVEAIVEYYKDCMGVLIELME